MKTLYAKGSKTCQCESSTLTARLIPLTYSPKKCMTALTHFQRLRDSFMFRLSDFLQQSLVDVHLSRQQDEPVLHQIMPSAASSSSSVMPGSYLSALYSLPLWPGSYLSALYSLPLCNTLLVNSTLPSPDSFQRSGR